MKRLIWDMEVSFNQAAVWRTGNKIHVSPESIITERQIISVAWKWHSEPGIYSLDWGTAQNDKDLCHKFNDVLNQADEVVAHFGDSFDFPWFRTRCLINGIITNPEVRTIDTCKWARKLYFNSCKLDYLAKVLGVGQKIPIGYDSWIKIILNNDQHELRQMIEYNKHDVTILEGVYDKLAPIMPHKTHIGVLSGGVKSDCPKCGSVKTKISKTRISAKGIKSYQMQCNSCGTYFTAGVSALPDMPRPVT